MTDLQSVHVAALGVHPGHLVAVRVRTNLLVTVGVWTTFVLAVELQYGHLVAVSVRTSFLVARDCRPDNS